MATVQGIREDIEKLDRAIELIDEVAGNQETNFWHVGRSARDLRSYLHAKLQHVEQKKLEEAAK